MNILEYGRSAAYWIMDSLKGGKVKKALELLKKCEDGIWSNKEVEEYQKNALKELLIHTKKTVPAYKTLNTTNLYEWPVTNKMTYKSAIDDYISDEYNKEDCIKMTTSGSTGTPFTCYQDGEKKRHVNAEVLYYNGKIGYKIGKRIVYFRSIVSEVDKSSFEQFTQNIILLDCLDLSDAGIKKNLAMIEKKTRHSGAMIMGYASTLTAFQKYFDKYGFEEAQKCKVYGIVSGSEMLFDKTRSVLEKAFNCKCVSRYANEENGFLGQDFYDNNMFIPNRANYYIEILKIDSDEPIDDGEIGRIVVTDLYNYAMPMIRYDTGDVGAWVEKDINGDKRKVIGSFGGRIVDMIFDCYGNQVSPHSITNRMWKYEDVKQYQLIQKTMTSYELRLTVVETQKINKEKLLKDYYEVLGEKADIQIVFCDEIPVLASGKRRYIVNEMKRKA